jgi:hypothetical protein
MALITATERAVRKSAENKSNDGNDDISRASRKSRTAKKSVKAATKCNANIKSSRIGGIGTKSIANTKATATTVQTSVCLSPNDFCADAIVHSPLLANCYACIGRQRCPMALLLFVQPMGGDGT